MTKLPYILLYTDGGEEKELCYNAVFPYHEDNEYAACVAAFTIAELGEMLPPRMQHVEENHSCKRVLICQPVKNVKGVKWLVQYVQCSTFPYKDDNLRPQYAETEADARARCLIYLVENKLISQGVYQSTEGVKHK